MNIDFDIEWSGHWIYGYFYLSSQRLDNESIAQKKFWRFWLSIGFMFVFIISIFLETSRTSVIRSVTMGTSFYAGFVSLLGSHG